MKISNKNKKRMLDSKNPKTVVTIPTYNESKNISKLIKSILSLKIKNLNILVIDDNSPDKTWGIVQNLSKKNPNIHLLLRKYNKGRGYAGKDGFIKALEMGADIVIEMDADFSHNPKYIPDLIEKAKHADIVLGSRLTKKGKDTRKSTIRKLITILANLYIQIILGIKVKDCNSGFRCFNRSALIKINPERIFSSGPSIVQEVLYKASLKKLKIVEIPIVFDDRIVGESKLGFKQLYKGYITVLKLKWFNIIGRL